MIFVNELVRITQIFRSKLYFFMAHQDYVSRSRAPSKKKSPYKKKPPETLPKFPLKVRLIGLLTLVIICGFTYFLWSIKDKNPNISDPTILHPTPKVTTKNSSALPTPPKEKWAYRKELAEKEVEEGQYEVAKKGPYKMQCGSFKTRAQAEVLKANIAFSGLSAQISESIGTKATYYKVYLGPYAKKRQAEKHKHQLKNNNINYCEIWNWK